MKLGCQVNYKRVGDWINIDVSSHGLSDGWLVKFYKQVNEQSPEQIYEMSTLGNPTATNELVFINYQFEDYDKGTVKFWATTFPESGGGFTSGLATSGICEIMVDDEPPICSNPTIEFGLY